MKEGDSGGMKTISIITVTFNAADTIKRTLDSIAAQTCRDFEHVIIDGGSTDGTMEAVNAYKDGNPGIQVVAVSESDKGLYDAMNKGLKRATGEYVCFLNAGDKFHQPQTLQHIVEKIAASSSKPAVVYGETDIVDADGRFLRHRRLQAPEKLTWKSFRKGMLVCHQSFYALRTIAPDYDLQYRFSADFDWCVRVMRQAEQDNMMLLNMGEVLTDYLAEGMTTQNHKASLKERFNIMAHHYGWFSTVLMHAWFMIRSVIKK